MLKIEIKHNRGNFQVLPQFDNVRVSATPEGAFLAQEVKRLEHRLSLFHKTQSLAQEANDVDDSPEKRAIKQKIKNQVASAQKNGNPLNLEKIESLKRELVETGGISVIAKAGDEGGPEGDGDPVPPPVNSQNFDPGEIPVVSGQQT